MLTFLAGIVAGLVLSAPLGPLGVLAAVQAAEGRLRAAWLLATGICLADSLLALLATWSIEVPVPDHWLNLMLGILMLGLAAYLAWSARHAQTMLGEGASFTLGLTATLLHPVNLVAFGLVFSWLHSKGLAMEALPVRLALVVGVLAGALMMWGIFIHLAARLGKRIAGETFQQRCRYILAVLCALTGLWVLANLAIF